MTTASLISESHIPQTPISVSDRKIDKAQGQIVSKHIGSLLETLAQASSKHKYNREGESSDEEFMTAPKPGPKPTSRTAPTPAPRGLSRPAPIPAPRPAARTLLPSKLSTALSQSHPLQASPPESTEDRADEQLIEFLGPTSTPFASPSKTEDIQSIKSFDVNPNDSAEEDLPTLNKSCSKNSSLRGTDTDSDGNRKNSTQSDDNKSNASLGENKQIQPITSSSNFNKDWLKARILGKTQIPSSDNQNSTNFYNDQKSFTEAFAGLMLSCWGGCFPCFNKSEKPLHQAQMRVIDQK